MFEVNTASLKEEKQLLEGATSNIIDKTIPLVKEHMVPQTNCMFMIETYDSQFIYLKNIITGRKKILIQGSC